MRILIKREKFIQGKRGINPAKERIFKIESRQLKKIRYLIYLGLLGIKKDFFQKIN